MSDDERIEQLELEVKVLQDNNKGLKEKNKELSDSYDKLAKECNEENRRCMLLAVENQDLKDKIRAKIEPKLKELVEQINEEWKKYGNSKELQDMEDMYNFLQSLLGKE